MFFIYPRTHPPAIRLLVTEIVLLLTSLMGAWKINHVIYNAKCFVQASVSNSLFVTLKVANALAIRKLKPLCVYITLW